MIGIRFDVGRAHLGAGFYFAAFAESLAGRPETTWAARAAGRWKNLTDAHDHRGFVELALLVFVEFVEQFHGCFLQLGERDLAVLVGVRALEDTGREKIAGAEEEAAEAFGAVFLPVLGAVFLAVLGPEFLVIFEAPGETGRLREDAIEAVGELRFVESVLLFIVSVCKELFHAGQKLFFRYVAILVAVDRVDERFREKSAGRTEAALGSAEAALAFALLLYIRTRRLAFLGVERPSPSLSNIGTSCIRLPMPGPPKKSFCRRSPACRILLFLAWVRCTQRGGDDASKNRDVPGQPISCAH